MKQGPTLAVIVFATGALLAAGVVGASAQQVEGVSGDAALGTRSYDDFEKPETCGSCHVEFYRQWEQAMMSQAYTHHWDEIEYFRLAVPHAEKDEVVAGVKAGCNGCHAPLSFLAGDVPPPRPEEGSRANESVSCDLCHVIKGAGDQGGRGYNHNFNYIVDPGRTKYGNKQGVESPHHDTAYLEFTTTPELCGTCHNEASPYGVWVKSTQIEWSQGPYAQEGVFCQDCHMPVARGSSAQMAPEDDIRLHLFHGAHAESKVRGAIDVRMNPEAREYQPGEQVVLTVQVFNQKAGHKIPTGSVEDRILWLHVTATDSEGNTYHLPVEKKGFDGEEYTIAADVLAYQDMGIPLGIEDFPGVQRDGVPVGDRIFRMPYFDPQGRMTIMQWNTKSQGVDYRIGPRETKQETYVWEVPYDVAPGRVTFDAVLNYQLLVGPVAEYLEVPAEESEPFEMNRTSTWIDVYE